MARLTMRDGARLHYLDIGRGAPCVLLHGFGMQASMWLPLVAPLALKYRFILPDLRGFGGSHRLKLSTPELLTQHADDVADLLEGLGLDEVRLGGLSMGACTALQYHRRYDFACVQRYLHMDQACCVLNRDDWSHGLLGHAQQDRLAHWSALMRDMAPYRELPFDGLPKSLRRRLWSVLAEFLSFAFHHRGWRGISRLARHDLLISRLAPTANWPIYMDTLRSYIEDDYDWRPSLPRIDVPMTVMIGGQSRMYPAEGQRVIRDLVPHARVIEFADSGHVIPFESPRRFVAELARFLEAA